MRLGVDIIIDEPNSFPLGRYDSYTRIAVDVEQDDKGWLLIRVCG